MKPHFGVEMRNYFTPSLSRIAALGGVDLTDEIIREVEGLVLFIEEGIERYLSEWVGSFCK